MKADFPEDETAKPGGEPVHIYRANGEGEYGRIAAILETAGIAFFPKSTGLQAALGLGISGMGTGGHSGPIDILVQCDDREKALALIKTEMPWQEKTPENT